MTPTPPAGQKLIGDMVSSLADHLGYLWSRWQDEREYEDIAEYGKTITVPPGVAFVKMTKRPFGFQFALDCMPGAKYSMTVTSRSVGWKRIG